MNVTVVHIFGVQGLYREIDSQHGEKRRSNSVTGGFLESKIRFNLNYFRRTVNDEIVGVLKCIFVIF